MRIIKSLVEKIDDELMDAEKYINCAYETKMDYPDVSNVFYKLSQEEMKHMQMLHTQVVQIIEEHKKMNEVPPVMKELYNYLHQRQIEWAAKIELKQKNYMTNK